jgi:DNA repair ATPase RecN
MSKSTSKNSRFRNKLKPQSKSNRVSSDEANKKESQVDKTKIHKARYRTLVEKPTAIETPLEKVDLDKGNKKKPKKAKSDKPQNDKAKSDQSEENNTECGELIKALNALVKPQEKYGDLVSSIKEARNNLVVLKEGLRELATNNAEFSSTIANFLNRLEKVELLADAYEFNTAPEVLQLIKDNEALTARVAKLEKKIK